MSKTFYFKACRFLPALIFFTTAQAQVGNNQIHERLRLSIDGPAIPSTTANSTVEWNCVNRALTNKCLVYHNDQWFSFNVSRPGKYFVAISSQNCKENKGVQLTILEGNPCEVSTYKVLQCIPQIRQEDVFVEVDSVKTGVEYLINVDGFLGDFCSFEIALSTKPKGWPRQWDMQDTVGVKIGLTAGVVQIDWEVTDSLMTWLLNFQIYRKRRGEQKAELVAELPRKGNAYGVFSRHYSLGDTLRSPGAYTYQIIGIRSMDGYPLLLSEQQIRYRLPATMQTLPVKIEGLVPLQFEPDTRFSVLVYDLISHDLLSKLKADFDPAKNRQYKIDFTEWVKKDHRQFLVLVIDEITQGADEFYFRWNGIEMIRE